MMRKVATRAEAAPRKRELDTRFFSGDLGNRGNPTRIWFSREEKRGRDVSVLARSRQG